jgi:MinD-like ATPase involved in chromosome partitioning or flagellar assembly
MADNSQVITFYSYKGGTGRTMTLANVAWILASNGKRVLAVDWDLEAPGLHRYFHPFLLDKECVSSPGVIDMVWDVSVSATKPAGSDPDPGWYRKYADVLEYAVSLRWAFPDGGTLDLLPAGRQGASYATRVNSFNWKNFYERFGGREFLDAAVTSMRKEYDYILIDSRTGVSDTSGICTVQLPDTLVACFTLNTQSVEGCAAVVRSVMEQRQENPVRVLPVPMRLEDGEKKKLDAGLDYALERFSPFIRLPQGELDAYWGGVGVPYRRYYAYEEVLAPFADRAKQTQAILPTAEKLASYLTDGAVNTVARISESERRRWLAEFERVGEDEGPLERGLAALRDGDLELAQRHLLRAVKDAEEARDKELLADASLQLSAVARRQGDMLATEHWYQRAIGTGEELPAAEDASEVVRLVGAADLLISRMNGLRGKYRLSDIVFMRPEIFSEAIDIAGEAAAVRKSAVESLGPKARSVVERSLGTISPDFLVLSAGGSVTEAFSVTAAVNAFLAFIFGAVSGSISKNPEAPTIITASIGAFFFSLAVLFGYFWYRSFRVWKRRRQELGDILDLAEKPRRQWSEWLHR